MKLLFICLITIICSNIVYSQNEWYELKLPLTDTNYYVYDITAINKDSCFLIIDNKLYRSDFNFTSLKEIYFHADKFDEYYEVDYKHNLLTISHRANNSLSENKDYMLISSNYGISWSRLSLIDNKLLLNPQLYGVIEKNNLNYLTFKSSKNSGKSWDIVFNYNYPHKESKEVVFRSNIYPLYLNSYLLYNVENYTNDFGPPYPNSESKVFLNKTTNNGLSWKIANGLELFNDLINISFLDSLNGFCVCYKISKKEIKYYKYLLKTTDGGLNWNEIYSVSDKSIPSLIYRFISPDIGWISANNILCSTKDGGLRFSYQDLLFKYGVIENILPISGDVCIVTINGKLFKTDIGGKIISQTDLDIKVEDIKPENLKNAEKEEKIRNDRKRAKKLYNEKKYKEAIPLYLDLVKNEDDGDFNTYFELAYSLNELTRYDEALYYYNEALYIDGEKASVYNNIGAIYQEMKNYDLSLEYYQKAYDIEPKELYSINIERIKKLSYKLSINDHQIINKYFPAHKRGTRLLYWQYNNTASYVEENYLENNNNTYANVVLNYYINRSAYQVKQVYLQESGYYNIDLNKLIYNGVNKMVGEYSLTKAAFPIDNTKWSVLGIQLGFLGYEDKVITNAGTFYNCLVIGKDYYKEYYAPDVGLVLVRAAISQPSFITEKELIDYTIVK